MKKHHLAFLLNLLFLAHGFGQQPPKNIVDGIDALFQAHVNQSLGLVPGHVLRVEKPGAWVYENAAGLSAVRPDSAMRTDKKFKVASITKMFTTVAIFKLIQEGKVDFSAPIGTYLPLSMIQNFDSYQQIRVKDLLSHTSGIREPQVDFQGRLNYWIYKKRFEDIPLDSLLFWSSGPALGLGNYNYSNANFYLLAEIIKSASGLSYKDYVTNTIITTLGLKNTDFNTQPTGNFMRGYLKGSFYPQGGVPDGLVPDSLYDFTEASNSWGYGAADIWSNTNDLIQFHKALFTGQLIAKKWLDTMKTLVTNTGDMGAYGYGMIQFKSFNNGPVYAFGHTGSAFGYGSMLCYIPSLDVYMSSAGNYMKIGQEFLQRDIYNFLVNTSLNLQEPRPKLAVQLYPNPAQDVLNITTQMLDYSVSVLSPTGQVLLELANARQIDISDFESGLYTLRLQDRQTMGVVVERFIKVD